MNIKDTLKDDIALIIPNKQLLYLCYEEDVGYKFIVYSNQNDNLQIICKALYPSKKMLKIKEILEVLFGYLNINEKLISTVRIYKDKESLPKELAMNERIIEF